MSTSIYIAKIYTHTAIMSIFLTIFFFTIASKEEGTITKNQVNFLLDSSVTNVIKSLPPAEKTIVKSNILKSLNNVKPQLEKEDLVVKENNDQLVSILIKIVGIVIVVSLVILILSGYFLKWTQKEIFELVIDTGVGLIFVAVIEILFLFLIAANYIAVDPNKIKYNFVNKIFVVDNE